MQRTLTPAALPLTALAAGLALLAPGVARAAAPTSYKIQPIVKLGDQVADVTIKAANKGGDLEMGTLNDSGQIAFVTENAAGGEMLLQWANGQFTPIVVAGRDAPGGKWATGFGVLSPVSMNQRGDIAFSTDATIGGTTDLGTFRWDYQTQKVTLVAFKGMPATNNLNFVNGSSINTSLDLGPRINNSDEIAFPAGVKNAAGATRSGVFFLGQDGQFQAVALPDQALPGGGTIQDAWPTGITDTGVVAFVTAAGVSSPLKGAYIWENGTITPITVVGTEIPGLGKVASVGIIRVNNKDRSALVSMQLNSTSAPLGFYRWANGQFTSLFILGQDMPGGGRLKWAFGPLFAFNDAGQFAFWAQISENGRTLTAAYLLDTDGTLSLILKSGTATTLGTITAVGPSSSSTTSWGIGLNSKGQVVLPVQIAGGPFTLVLLTPSAP